ncbi:hypothetical protein R3P38DRAFT_606869 [Favolaschia claudopus]|uniref:F-box domain-containing protein n=1 Tax=Favolaschia claudopus TaxID=2862362 RepID=A0AAW0C7W6_9AGAR
MTTPSRRQHLTLEPLDLRFNNQGGLHPVSPGYLTAPAASLLTPNSGVFPQSPWAASPSSAVDGSSYFPSSPSSRLPPQSAKSPLSPGFSKLLRQARSFTNLGSKRSRRPAVELASRLPPEIWLKVFMHIPLFLLPPVTLACRSFYSLAQPMLFSTISTHPRVAARANAATQKYHKSVFQRVQFFFSPRICPSIVECSISPPSPEEHGDITDNLIDVIFESLPKLPNLKVLGCRYVRLTPKRLDVLQRLQLTSLSLEMCFGDMMDFADAPSVALQEVTFKYSDAAMGREPNPCLLFLSPNHLEQLHATTTSILVTLANSSPFKKLRTLEIPVECVTSTDLFPALSRCPAVEHLSIHVDSVPYPRPPFESLPDGVLPLLKTYRGPHSLAATFLRGRSPREVDVSLPCHPSRLEASLAGVERSLQSLSFRLDGVELPSSLLGAIHKYFPVLKSLAVKEPALSSSDIQNALRSVPAHRMLEEVTLRIQGRDKFNLWIPPDESAADAVSSFRKTLPALLVAYPQLKIIKLLHGAEGAVVKWCRSTLDGNFIQVSA